MERYTIYCTPEQTKKALELGAPIRLWEDIPQITPATGYYLEYNTMFALPTAEQMIGWLEYQGIQITTHVNAFDEWECLLYEKERPCFFKRTGAFESSKDALLAAIDAALEYLENNGKN